MSSTNVKELKDLRERIHTLELCEHIEVLKILLKNNVKYTENSNGVFVNMNKLTTNCLNDIRSFLSFIDNNLNKI
tara:strand:+ start:65 stop:289 length:225 start_codon:yes stop_codon:yes gene_type:complete